MSNLLYLAISRSKKNHQIKSQPGKSTGLEVKLKGIRLNGKVKQRVGSSVPIDASNLIELNMTNVKGI